MTTQEQQLPQAKQPTELEQYVQRIKNTNVEELVTTMEDKATRACAALSQVQKIEDDETDLIANNLLVKVRVTLEGAPAKDNQPKAEGLVDKRMGVTKIFDGFKALLMGPEKRIQAEAARVQGLRNAWAKKKADEKLKKDAEIALKKAKADEEARVKAAMKKSVVDGIVGYIQAMNQSIQEHVASMTLDNWDLKMQKFTIKPVLRQERYDALFNVAYNTDLITSELFAAIQADVKKEADFTYEKVSTGYLQQAEGTIKMWVDGLPAKKVKLEEIKKLKEENEAEAQRQLEELKQKEAQQGANVREQAEKVAEAAQAEIQREQDESLLKNEFQAQVQSQQQAPNMQGVRDGRVAVINCKDEDIVKTFAQVLYACYSNPKFKGHLKRDRKGVVLGDDAEGFPQYADWAAHLLDFVAKEYPGDKIEGIKFLPRITTVATAKK